uniref:CBF1-interacting co-repressor CIR N-terminal domain-containing protein n=1 Tax=Pyrodinium bahamense TaxID=73915 RepID=A0A7S0FWW2_9DINO|mmetsp:Transcript_6618/g.18048  ORF Transcript_6618/g.18048 Transcript_6618/m.18048 type:complete len:370 (+) Transcript_6618:64-1173(+)
MGRHGGINILHQKSWHVWRLDNRLTVERDELRHAAEERKRVRLEHQAAFGAKLARLRRRAAGADGEAGEEEPEKVLPPCGLAEEVGGAASSTTVPKQEKGRKGNRIESSYKYGMVTTSNLKLAEQDLESKLKGKKPPERYWGSAALGTGPHINLFEEAELESKHHVMEHQKQISYTARNNELAQKSKKALFSDFDEVSSDSPWYLRPRKLTAAPEDGEDPRLGSPLALGAGEALRMLEDGWQRRSKSRSRSRSGLQTRRRWSERHGQATLRVTVAGPVRQRRTDAEETAPAELVSSSEEEGHKRKKKKPKRGKEERRKKKRAKEGREDKEELATLRAERERREQEERARTARLVGPGNCIGRSAWGCGA